MHYSLNLIMQFPLLYQDQCLEYLQISLFSRPLKRVSNKYSLNGTLLSAYVDNMSSINVTYLLFFLSFIKAAEITHYWSDHRLLPPTVVAHKIPSIPSCIHRCIIHNRCNMVAVYASSLNNFICLFAWMKCFEKYDERIVPAKGWGLYALRNKGIY